MKAATGPYDYVIVGGGAAGCVLAERLSANPASCVLLLEAGPPDTHPFIHMPRGLAKILADPAYVWPFRAEAGAGSNRPAATWVRGRTLGGSSSTNGMMYVRGQPADWDALAAVSGSQWAWANIAPIFRAAERHPLGADATRGDSGPLGLSLPRRHPVMDQTITAGVGMGLAAQSDINAPDDALKIGYCPATIRRGRRQSAAAAFLARARSRPNLTVVTGAVADRVVFDGRAATGVACLVDGESTVFFGRRVILSAGTIASPAILQRSGIGPATLLARHGIAVLADRAEVGANLREHCALAMQWRLREGASLNPQFGGWRLLRNVARYYLLRDGPMASAAYDVLGCFRADGGIGRPDAQLIASPFSIDKSAATLRMERAPGMQVAVYPLRPRARGWVRIESADPAILPTSSLDFFSDGEDRRIMLGAVRFVRALMASPALRDIVVAETRPGRAVDDDAAILDAYREMGSTAYHAAGTCRMGNDEDAVVDPHTRVRGVERLHVVDLSIAPEIPAGNTFAPVMAIAWRAAELIAGLDRA